MSHKANGPFSGQDPQSDPAAGPEPSGLWVMVKSCDCQVYGPLRLSSLAPLFPVCNCKRQGTEGHLLLRMIHSGRLKRKSGALNKASSWFFV